MSRSKRLKLLVNICISRRLLRSHNTVFKKHHLPYMKQKTKQTNNKDYIFIWIFHVQTVSTHFNFSFLLHMRENCHLIKFFSKKTPKFKNKVKIETKANSTSNKIKSENI